MRPLWAGDPKNLHNSFFVKNFYLDLNFFEVLQIALLKNEKKKKDANHLKIAWHSQIQKKSIEKRERKTKKEKLVQHWSYRGSTSNQNTWQQTSYFNVDFDSNGLLFLFSYTPEKCLQFSKKTKAFVKKHF